MIPDLLARRDALVTWCVCGGRVFAGRPCTTCALLTVETAREAS